jgi:hypothetical protein
VARLTGQRWRAMSEVERAPNKKQALEDTVRYKKVCFVFSL